MLLETFTPLHGLRRCRHPRPTFAQLGLGSQPSPLYPLGIHHNNGIGIEPGNSSRTNMPPPATLIVSGAPPPPPAAQQQQNTPSRVSKRRWNPSDAQWNAVKGGNPLPENHWALRAGRRAFASLVTTRTCRSTSLPCCLGSRYEPKSHRSSYGPRNRTGIRPQECGRA